MDLGHATGAGENYGENSVGLTGVLYFSPMTGWQQTSSVHS